LFGTATISDQHFARYSFEATNRFAGAWVASLADWGIVKMMNPMYYIGASGTTSSHYWRIRHGGTDADTSLPIPVSWPQS